MSGDPSRIRMNALRLVYLLTGIVLGSKVWPALIHRVTPWDPLHGVAYSFWAAFSMLMLVGVGCPIRMLPLLLLQLSYKLIWLIGVGYPLWAAGHSSPVASELVKACAIGAAVDLIVIPWPYVFENYVKAIFTRQGNQETLSPELVPPMAK